MIARPLDLASRLRPAPRSFDAFYYVNAGLLALFFALFGSRFVLEPGLGLDFSLPESGGGAASGTAEFYLSIENSGQIFTGDGLLSRAQLGGWLKARVEEDRNRRPSLLIRASAGVPFATVTEIANQASAAGFSGVILAEEPSEPPESGGR
jgi:biopolymer transport protein ExbD